MNEKVANIEENAPKMPELVELKVMAELGIKEPTRKQVRVLRAAGVTSCDFIPNEEESVTDFIERSNKAADKLIEVLELDELADELTSSKYAELVNELATIVFFPARTKPAGK